MIPSVLAFRRQHAFRGGTNGDETLHPCHSTSSTPQRRRSEAQDLPNSEYRRSHKCRTSAHSGCPRDLPHLGWAVRSLPCRSSASPRPVWALQTGITLHNQAQLCTRASSLSHLSRLRHHDGHITPAIFRLCIGRLARRANIPKLRQIIHHDR